MIGQIFGQKSQMNYDFELETLLSSGWNQKLGLKVTFNPGW